MGQMSNQWEREGHGKKLAEAVMLAHGGLNLHSNSSKEYPKYMKMSQCGAVRQRNVDYLHNDLYPVSILIHSAIDWPIKYSNPFS